MFDSIFLAIETWMRGMLTSMVDTNLAAMFTEVNAKTADIASQVGRTPQGWNGSIFSDVDRRLHPEPHIHDHDGSF